MEQDSKLKNQLAAAYQLFTKADYSNAKKTLGDIKLAHMSIELNIAIAEYKQSPQRIAAVIKKLMDILTSVNIKLYQDRPVEQSVNILKNKTQKPPKITHELYYWNIIVLSQIMGNLDIAELIANQAMHYTDALRTQTSLMVLYHVLKMMERANRVSSCIAVIEKQNRIVNCCKKINKEEQSFRILSEILYRKALLKIGMISSAKITSGIILNQTEEKQQQQITQINGIPIGIHLQFLQSEAEYFSKNYSQAIKILSQILQQAQNSKRKQIIKGLIDHNMGVILANMKQTNAGQLMFKKSLGLFMSNKELENSNQKIGLVNSCQENMIMAAIIGKNQNYGMLYQSFKTYGYCASYKLAYRKAQICLNYYHQLLQNPARVLTHQQIHDFYETVYYYPNMPYFQQKGKNKNSNYTNGKYYYRRYILPKWQNDLNENYTVEDNVKKVEDVKEEQSLLKPVVKEEAKRQASKDRKKDKSVKQKNKKEEQNFPSTTDNVKENKQFKNISKLQQILQLASTFLKKSLNILEKQKSIIVTLEGQQKGLTVQLNEKLFNEYIQFKSSIYAQLCYISLCCHDWLKTIHYAQQYQNYEKIYQLQSKTPAQQKIFYNIMTYRMEALSQLNRIPNAYEVMHDVIANIDYSQNLLPARSTSNQQPGMTFFEKTSQYNNFCYNISILHSRDNKIPEAFQAIQKILQQMRLSPSNPQSNLPLSLIDLLVHYNLRTGNTQSALQMIKRRRILNLPSVMGHYQPILSVTK